MVPPIRLLKAILMLRARPLRDREILSRISGISEATGAKKNASKIGFTSSVLAVSATDLIVQVSKQWHKVCQKHVPNKRFRKYSDEESTDH
jgi:hypothetical protein